MKPTVPSTDPTDEESGRLIKEADVVRDAGRGLFWLSFGGMLFGYLIVFVTSIQVVSLVDLDRQVARAALQRAGLPFDHYLMLLAVIVAVELALVLVMTDGRRSQDRGIARVLLQEPLRMCIRFCVFLSGMGAGLVLLGDITAREFSPLLLLTHGALVVSLQVIVAVAAIIFAAEDVSPAPEQAYLVGYRLSERVERVGADLEFGRGHELDEDHSPGGESPQLWVDSVKLRLIAKVKGGLASLRQRPVVRRLGGEHSQTGSSQASVGRYVALARRKIPGFLPSILRFVGSGKGRCALAGLVVLSVVLGPWPVGQLWFYGFLIGLVYAVDWIFGSIVLHWAVALDDYVYFPLRLVALFFALGFAGSAILAAWVEPYSGLPAALVSVIGVLVVIEVLGRGLVAPAGWARLGLEGLLVRARANLLHRVWESLVLEDAAPAVSGDKHREFVRGWNHSEVKPE